MSSWYSRPDSAVCQRGALIDDLDAKIGPLWGEADEDKRIAGWKEVDKYIAENAYVIPLIQYVQPILHVSGVKVTPHASGALLPHLMTRG